MLYRFICFPALFLGLLLGACGDPVGGGVETFQRPITNGDPDNSQAHMAVVALQVGNGYCSGTLIHDRIVLTAAHCVENVSTYNIDIGFGTSYNWGGDVDWVGASEKWVHPDYVGTTQNNAYDIALVRLSQSPPISVTPIPHLPGSLRLVNPDDIGIPIEFVGFGQTETGSMGVKMTVTGTLNWICDSSHGCWVDMQKGWFAYAYTICTDQEPGGPCGGDSGGPAFVWRNGHEYTAGITSYGVNQSCTGFGCSTKVDAFEGEILDFIGGVNGSSCSSGSQCDSGICEDGVCCNTTCTGDCRFCNLRESLGTCATAPNGYPCPDADICNGAETCQNGVCINAPDLTCDDYNLCTVDSCNSATGCVHTPVANGTSCSDGDVCTGVETCQNGNCVSDGELDCDDGDPCTGDSCHPQTGCSHTPLQDGTPCGDNNDCNGVDVCQDGECVPGGPMDCDDDNTCTADQCIPGTGCVHDPLPGGTPCNDGDVCTVGDSCAGGVCSGSPADCDDHDPCTTDVCDALSGCVHTTLPDGTGCGGGVCGQAVCVQGVCEPVGSGVSCEDYDPCTRDWCDSELGCQHEVLPDGSDCGQCDMCVDGECIHLDDCGNGGGCSSTGAPGGPAGVFGLLVLVLGLVRRKSVLT